MRENLVQLGDVIFANILKNPYLNTLYESLLHNYAVATLSLPNMEEEDIDVTSLLCFADLLSKSTHKEEKNQHKILAQEIVTLMNELYPDNPSVKYYLGSVLSSIGNYSGVSLKANKFVNLIPEEEYGQRLEKQYLTIPTTVEKHFFPEQKLAFDSLDSELCSFSAPTSLGKTFVINSFITARIAEGLVSNYAIALPTKALISEVSFSLGTMLKETAPGRKYRIINTTFPSETEKDCSYVTIMTPEQLHHTICSNKAFHIDWLFVDEAYKISQKNNKRSAYYYDLIDEIQRKTSHIIFSSPAVPNPELYLEMVQTKGTSENLLLTFSPVSQMKFLFDENTGEIFIYNSLKKEPLLVFTDKQIKYLDLINSMQEKNKKSIVYCGTRKMVQESALEYLEYRKKQQTDKKADSKQTGKQLDLNELSNELKAKVHEQFWLAETVRNGIGYHMGFLPASIRNEIESSFRNTEGGLDVIFCTSTLLEGVNLPADNIFITSTNNGGEMTSLDFRNLMGRVGRIGYNLHGNVFLVHRKRSLTTIDSFKNLLEKPIEKQQFSFVDVLSYEKKSEIVENLKQGKVGTPSIHNEEDSKENLERALSNKLLKDIVTGNSGVLKESFNDVLSDDEESAIEKLFSKDVPVPEDIYISFDQNEKLIEKIRSSGLCFPDVNAEYNDIRAFLEELKDAFEWEKYEPRTLGKGKRINHYAMLVFLWVNENDIKKIIESDIKRETDLSSEEINQRISGVLEDIDTIIEFKLCRYFRQFAQIYEYCTGQKPEYEWDEFLEYGSKYQETISLCKLGFTRETAKQIRKQWSNFVTEKNGHYYLSFETLMNNEMLQEEANRVMILQGNSETRQDILVM